jgi:hypothetical protein
MRKYFSFLSLIALISFANGFGQCKCTISNLYGEWRQNQSLYGIHTNIDSLKMLIVDSTKTIGTLTFKPDSTYY